MMKQLYWREPPHPLTLHPKHTHSFPISSSSCVSPHTTWGLAFYTRYQYLISA